MVIAADGVVSAYQARTGDQVWTHRVGPQLRGVTASGAQVLVAAGGDTESWSIATGRRAWSLSEAEPAVQPDSSCTTGGVVDPALFVRGDQLLAVRPDGRVGHSWVLPSGPSIARSVSCAAGRIWVVTNDPNAHLRVETVGAP